MMAALAEHFNNGRLISARQLASDGHFSYQLGCKLLQKLHRAELVKSGMGPKGGFTLSREPSKITLMQIIKALQGGIRLNRCLLDGEGCEFESDCEINTKLSCLQLYIDGYLNGITLAEIIKINELNSLIVIHMEAPCCLGLRRIAQKA
ncbi:MAG: Rrf2 family transcriptional regulator, partial [Planctomycetota bacterium]